MDEEEACAHDFVIELLRHQGVSDLTYLRAANGSASVASLISPASSAISRWSTWCSTWRTRRTSLRRGSSRYHQLAPEGGDHTDTWSGTPSVPKPDFATSSVRPAGLSRSHPGDSPGQADGVVW